MFFLLGLFLMIAVPISAMEPRQEAFVSRGPSGEIFITVPASSVHEEQCEGRIRDREGFLREKESRRRDGLCCVMTAGALSLSLIYAFLYCANRF